MYSTRAAAGLLVALAALALFHGSVAADPGPVQNFDATAGLFSINADTCWEDATASPPEHPALVAGRVVCGPNTSNANAPIMAPIRSYSFLQMPVGNRLGTAVTFTPSGPGEFSTYAPNAVCVTPPGPDGCDTGSSIVGEITAETDLLCNNTADVLAATKVGGAVSWPDDPSNGVGWIGPSLSRTADAVALVPPTGAHSYVSNIHPFPSSFTFDSLDSGGFPTAFLNPGFAPFPLFPPSALQVYTAWNSYGPGTIKVSTLLMGGDPKDVPTNDYLCIDSPQSNEISNEYLVPPTTSGLWPRWVAITAAPDLMNGDLSRILDLQCLGVGTVTSAAGAGDTGATDADDDCLTPAQGDTNDANSDQDVDGLPDGVEFYAGSAFVPATCAGGPGLPASDCDLDGVSDYGEMFQFTDPNDADTDNDDSLDKQDIGADETTGTPVVDDTITDDNCPFTSNFEQLNTDSAQSYHGGNNSFWTNRNAGTTTPAGPPPATLITSFGPSNFMSISVSGAGVATVDTNTAHNFVVNQLVEISGVTGVALIFPPTTPVQANSFRNAVNGVVRVTSVGVGGTNFFTFQIAAVTPAAPGGPATGTIVVRPATGDATNPDQDTMGDACDLDKDNDGLTNDAEALITYLAVWPGAGSTSCLGDGSGVVGAISLDPLSGDSDQDMVLDGIECQMGSRPDIASTAAAPCTPGSAGCAQPKVSLAAEDADGDGLYASGKPDLIAELFYRTQGINQHIGAQVNDVDGDGAAGTVDRDSDADWNIKNMTGFPVPSCSPTCGNSVALQDGAEVKFYGTQPSNGDTDVDGCDDAREVGDVNGDRTVNPGDQAIIANRVVSIASLDNGKAGDPTVGDRQVNPYGINFDLNKDRVINVGDQALVAFLVAQGGACRTSRQVGKTPSTALKLPFQ